MMRIKLLPALSILVLLFGLVLFFADCRKKRDAKSFPYLKSFTTISPDAFFLVFSSNLEGYIEPCGCTSNPLGGIDRFAVIYQDIKRLINDRISLIDTGNLLFDTTNKSKADSCQDNAKIEILLSTLQDLGLNATFSAGFDDALGEQFRQEIYKKFGLSLFSSSAPYIIKTKSFNLGVFAVNEQDFNAKNKSVFIKTVLESIKTHELKGIIVISHMPQAKTLDYFNDVDFIDVIIQANTSNMEPALPQKLGLKGPVLVEGGRQGQYFTGLLWQNISKRTERLEFDDRLLMKNNRQELLITRIEALNQQIHNAHKENLAFLNNRLLLAQQELLKLQEEDVYSPLSTPNLSLHVIPITKKIEQDPTIKAKIEDYEKNIPLLVKKCEETIECPKVKHNQPTYVGAETCKACHSEAYNVWKKSITVSKGLNEQGLEINRTLGHSKAWKTLVDTEKDMDRSCIGCHSIGFMEPGGYCKASQVDFRKDVQCESCHGAGSLHAQSGDKRLINRTVTEETCRSCHHVPHIERYESFNYEERLIKILGKGHGENLLKELIHKRKNLN